jgi:hypothetical protein
MSVLLFDDKSLDSALEATATRATDRLDRWDHDELLNAAQADVIEELINEATLECTVSTNTPSACLASRPREQIDCVADKGHRRGGEVHEYSIPS